MQAQNIMSRRNHEQIDHSSDEAEEEHEQVEVEVEVDSGASSEEEGEDLLEDAERDYQSIEKLDRYEDEGVDHEVHDLNPQARRAAEKQLAKNDLQNGEDFQVEAYMQQGDDQQDDLKRKYYDLAMDELDHDYDEESICNYIDAEDQKGSFETWVNLDAVRQYIRHHLVKLITKFTENGRVVYRDIIKDMVCENKQTLILDYHHLKAASQRMAKWLAFHPISFIPELNATLFSLICKTYPNYKEMKECFVRVYQLPVVDSLRALSHSHLGKLIKIKGMVTTRSDVHNQLIKVLYKCYSCGVTKGPYHITTGLGMKPELGHCTSCQSNGPFILEKTKSIYRNFQKITIQESPSSVPPGRIPRSKEAIAFGDIVDTVKPGDQVQIVGIFLPKYECSVNIKQGFPIFSTFIQTNSIKHCDEVNQFAVIDQQQFQKLPKMPEFAHRFYNSIAPSIYGHTRVKKALTMAMFGGVSKFKDNHRTRGDINVLLLGDPGVAKSQFLKSVQKVFPRCIYTTGKGASAVGLTACVKQDSQTKQWKLEAGALVLADKGLCLIDEFDKMSQGDRTSIHEAMQQQTISISKAGIIANLNARCSVIAAANPFGGCYKETLSFAENVNLTDPIISRFDIINVIKDRPNTELDGRLCDFVVNQHMRSHPYFKQYAQTKEMAEEETDKQYFLERSQDFIKQYIKYAREKYQPTFTAKCSSKIQTFYEMLRKDARQTGGVNIVPRHLESMVRICEANARMHLRNETTIEDADFAISMMMQTFVETQKHSVAERIRKTFKNYLNCDKH